MEHLNFYFAILLGFGAGVFCTWFFLTDRGITYDGERHREPNNKQCMNYYRQQYGIPVSDELYNAWKKSFIRKK